MRSRKEHGPLSSCSLPRHCCIHVCIFGMYGMDQGSGPQESKAMWFLALYRKLLLWHGFQTLGFEETNFLVFILGQNQRLKCWIFFCIEISNHFYLYKCICILINTEGVCKGIGKKALRIIHTNLIDMINGLFFVTQWKVKNHKTMITNSLCIVLDTLKVSKARIKIRIVLAKVLKWIWQLD